MIRRLLFLTSFVNKDHLFRCYSLPFLCQKMVWVFLFLILPFFSSAQPIKTSRIKTIVIDPGHGGKDPGNLGTRRYKTSEKDITLDLSLLVGKYLNQAFPDLKVLYTRNEDFFIKLNERTEFANKNDADLFISIHCNANESKRPKGADTWVMGPHKNEANLAVAQKENAAILLEENYKESYGAFDPNSPETYLALSLRQNVHLYESLTLAEWIQDEFRTRVGRVDRGVRQSGFYVISFTTMPSVLIETGFLTNPDEEDFLNSKKGQEYMASAIYRAIKKYIMSIEDLAPDQVGKAGDDAIESDTSKVTKSPEVIPVDDLKESSPVNYRIQIMVSSEKKATDDPIFGGLEPISRIKSGTLYKYYFERVGSYKEAKLKRNEAVTKGFEEAFVVSFNKETRIELQEALNLERKSIN